MGKGNLTMHMPEIDYAWDSMEENNSMTALVFAGKVSSTVETLAPVPCFLLQRQFI